MPAYTDDTWRLTFGQKKQLFGRHRCAVGGSAPEGAELEGACFCFKFNRT